jgi:hypothetical protein
VELKGKALLVYRDEAVFGELRRVLQWLGIEAVRVSGCAELQSRLQGVGPFLTVFTEATLPDGGYTDVCRIASQPLIKNQDSLHAVFYKGDDQVARAPVTLVSEASKARQTEVHSEVRDDGRIITLIRLQRSKEALIFEKTREGS